MDKYEYRVRTEQMLEYVEQKSYKKAMEIADSIDWRKAKNAAMLCTASEIYEYNGEYEKSREILFIAYDRAPGSRKIVYRLGTLALKLNDVKEATDCYEEFIAMAPKDPNQYILRYKILKIQQAPLSQQIEALEEFKKAEYVEKWAYELARLYHEAGMEAECLEECDDLILWFSEGKYVYQAMELKMKYKPLTPLQQEKYNHRNEEKKPIKESVQAVEEVAEEAVEEAAEEVVEEIAEEPTEEVVEEIVEEPVEEVVEEIVEEPAEEVVEEIVEEPAEEVVEEIVEEPAEEVVEEIVEEPAEEVVEEIVEEPAEEVVEEIVEEPAEEVVEEIVEEPVEEVVEEIVEESVEEPIEDVMEISEEALKEAAANKEIFSQESKMSVEEILQDWEEKQKENAQMIQEEQERAKREKEEQQAQKAEEESILPDDIRQLMEELEAEAAEITMSKIRKEEEIVAEEAVEPEETGAVEEEMQPIENAFSEKVEEVEEEVEEDPFDEESFDEETFEEVESENFEEIEEIEEIEESEGIKLGDTQAIAISAKALMNDTVIEDPIEKEEKQFTQPSSPFDTAFIVQGRYDLEAQSEIGIKAGLTEEQKKLFSYFVPVHGMSEQIVDVLENDKKCRTRYGTSRTANLLVVGRKGSGKTVLAVDIVKAIQKNRKLKQGKVGIVTAESLNKKDVSHIIKKLHGGAIIIERASKLSKKTVMELNDLMEEQTGELLVVLEEERRPLDKMLALYPDFKKKFTSRLELPVFINDELVTFAQTYAKENGFKIDEMGILALYSRIDLLQREESIVTVADVKEIIDEAIEHSRKWTFKKFLKKLFGKKKSDTSRIVLQEQDFK